MSLQTVLEKIAGRLRVVDDPFSVPTPAVEACLHCPDHPGYRRVNGLLTPCSCVKGRVVRQRMLDWAIAEAGLIGYEGMTLDRYQPSRANYGVWAAITAYSQPTPCLLPWLVIVGQVGVGKTHAAAAVALEWILRGHSVLFTTAADLVAVAQENIARSRRGEETDPRIGRALSIGLLIVDDLGVQQATSYGEGIVYRVLEHRYSRRLPTIITANMTPADFGDRLGSRLLDTSRVRLAVLATETDYRLDPGALARQSIPPVERPVIAMSDDDTATPYHRTAGGLTVVCKTCHCRPCLVACGRQVLPEVRP